MRKSEYFTWYLIVLAVAFSTIAIVFIVPSNLVFGNLRAILGLAFVLVLPGYAFKRLVFKRPAINDQDKFVGIIVQGMLSLVMSFVLVIITALALNYTPFGITTQTVTLSLFALTIVLATVALLTDLKAKNPLNRQEV